MPSDSRSSEQGPALILNCPGYKPAGAHGGASAQPGQLTFTVGSRLVAELAHDDLLESWSVAEELTPAETAQMAQIAAGRLTEILENGLPAADITDAVTDAAVIFLLAMKRHGITDPKRIPACTVMWHGHEDRERVLLGS